MKHGQRMTKARQRGDSAMQCVRSISLPQNAQFYPWDGNDLNYKYIDLARYPTSIKILATKSQLNLAKLSKCYSSKGDTSPLLFYSRIRGIKWYTSFALCLICTADYAALYTAAKQFFLVFLGTR